VAPLLRAAGHEVLAPDLPGMGEDRTQFAADILAQWADFVADLARRQDEPVVLVGHSRGGIVISEAAERVPDSIRRLVYLAAFLLPAGRSLIQSVEASGPGAGPPLTIGADGLTCTVSDEAHRGVFYNQLSEPEAKAIGARLCPEPLEPLSRGLRITDGRYGSVPRAYILAEHDQAITLDWQRRMLDELPCDPVLSLPSDHSPFYSMPHRLAEALVSLA
jgi:pimeloyl-ACP methyl ester carboxylesterase